MRFLREIVYAIRAPGVVPEDFVLGVKLDSADYARDTAEPQESRALDHVREIGSWQLVDFIEVSGGDYEDPRKSYATPLLHAMKLILLGRVHRQHGGVQVATASNLRIVC